MDCSSYFSREEFVANLSKLLRVGIRVDPKKIEAILDWKQPRSVTKVYNFLDWIVTT